jgi:phosphomannomutase
MKVSRENALPVGFDNGLGQIQEWILAGRECTPAPEKGQVHPMDIRQDYLDFLLKYKGDWSGLKIAMDVSNGMASLFVRDIFGDQPAYIYDEMDGRFPNHEPNPLVQKNVEALKKLVAETGSDIGVIYDGDADRVMFVDENSRFISPDLMIAVLGHYFLEERGEKGIVIQDIRSSKAVGEYLAPLGGSMYTWKVGRAFAAHKLREINGVYGGELAGHYYFRDFFYSDSGLLASILILNVVAKMKAQGVSLSQLISRIEKYQSSGEVNFRIEDKKGAMDVIRDYFMSAEESTAYMDFDGYRVEFPEWWFNIRPSNTEPYLRFICEATSAGLLEEKLETVRRILKEQFGA